MKLSEFKGEEALDVLVELLDPIGEILADKDVKAEFQKNNMSGVKAMLKGHKKAVITMMAILEREEPDEYIKKVNLLTLPMALLEILNDPDVTQLFTSQGQIRASSGSATASTGENEL